MNRFLELAWVAGTPVRALLIASIRVYRVTLGGIFGGQCRFFPTCSMYAEEAIRNHGAIRGTALAAWRIARCSPLTAGGVDHVAPSRRHEKYDGVTQVRA